MSYPDDLHDPFYTKAEAYDDRDEPGRNIDEEDAFNQPEDRVAHL